MKYTNSQIYNELKRISNCHEKYDDLEQVGKEIYKIKNVGIRNYLIKNGYIEMNPTNINREIPFLLPYGNDFLKKNKILLRYDDYKSLILFILTILGTFAAIIGAYYGYLAYIKN